MDLVNSVFGFSAKRLMAIILIMLISHPCGSWTVVLMVLFLLPFFTFLSSAATKQTDFKDAFNEKKQSVRKQPLKWMEENALI
jgi:Flp pilus assembly protein TadB